MKKVEEKISLQPSHILVFRYVEKYIKKNLFSPTLQEIADHIKLTHRHVFRLVGDLIALGFLSKSLGKKRSIVVVKNLE